MSTGKEIPTKKKKLFEANSNIFKLQETCDQQGKVERVRDFSLESK